MVIADNNAGRLMLEYSAHKLIGSLHLYDALNSWLLLKNGLCIRRMVFEHNYLALTQFRGRDGMVTVGDAA
jgi:hypothetical protein